MSADVSRAEDFIALALKARNLVHSADGRALVHRQAAELAPMEPDTDRAAAELCGSIRSTCLAVPDVRGTGAIGAIAASLGFLRFALAAHLKAPPPADVPRPYYVDRD